MPDSYNNNSWTRQLFMKLMQLPSTNLDLLSTCEEDLGEADEPPDDSNVRFVHPGYYSDSGFKKRAVVKPAQHRSLLTQALTSPELSPVDRGHFNRDLRNGFSGASIWSLSGASTAELTSDGGLSSRSHSPSPPHPPMLPVLGHFFHDRKSQFANEKRLIEIAGDSDVLEGLGRKRAIRFACNTDLSPQPKDTEPMANKAPSQAVPAAQNISTPPRRNSTIRFVCSQQGDKTPKPQTQSQTCAKIRFTTPEFSSLGKSRRDSESTVTSSTPKPIQPPYSPTLGQRKSSNISSSNPATRFYEFASSIEETESWMQQPPYGSRLLRVDGVLEKENGIRKLTEEAEEEAKEEEGELDDDVDLGEDEEAEADIDVEGVDEENIEEEQQDEEELEEEIDNLSGNESDNEEGFASDDEDDEDDFFFRFPHLPASSPMLPRKPACCRTLSESSRESSISSKYGGHKPSKADLPDSTDFVCGTFDEDKAVEDAYVSALEEKKRAKHRITPHDIDPSFPSSDPESEKDVPESVGSYHCVRGRGSSSGENGAPFNRGKCGILNYSPHAVRAKIRFQSPVAPRRRHSPAPKRRMFSPPPPLLCRDSKHTSPLVSRRNSNEQSSPTAVHRGPRCFSPPPPARHTLHMAFISGPNLGRTKSLPRNIRACNRGRSSNEMSTGQSPKGLPIGSRCVRKLRRKEGCAKPRPESWSRRGEGVEKMRKVGLMLGKGKPPMPWLSSI